MQHSFGFGSDSGSIASIPERAGPAWEGNEELGTVSRLLKTLQSSLFNPTGFFREMRRTGGYLNPLVYAIVLGSFSVIVAMGWELLFVSSGDVILDTASSQQLVGLRPVLYGVIAILSPVLVTLLVIVSSGVFHVMLLAFGGAAHGFQASFRVVCYSRSTGIWNIVPFVGPIVGGIWHLALLVIGLTETHEISIWKALAAVLVPLVVWLILVVGMFIVVSSYALL